MFRGSYILRCEILFTIVYVGMALRLYVRRSADNAEMILQAFMFTMIYDSLLWFENTLVWIGLIHIV